jgi:hypothetical protein
VAPSRATINIDAEEDSGGWQAAMSMAGRLIVSNGPLFQLI